MRALLVVVSCFIAAPAFATGERVLLSGNIDVLRPSLCVSMACVGAGARDAVVAGRSVRAGLEVTVKSASGVVKLVHVVPLSADGRHSSIELMRATSLVLQAIESPRPLRSSKASASHARQRG